MNRNYILCLLFAFLSLLPCHSQNSISYEYDQAGNRTLRKVIVLQGPQSIKNHTSTDSTVVKEILNYRQIKIYPNPTKGILKIELPLGKDEKPLQIQLFNGSGNVLINQDAVIGVNELDLSVYPKGWYILRIISAEIKKEFKIIKE